MRLTSHQLLAIRKQAPGFELEEISPGACRVALGRVSAILLKTRIGWETTGPWQIVRNQEMLRDRDQLLAILRGLGVKL